MREEKEQRKEVILAAEHLSAGDQGIDNEAQDRANGQYPAEKGQPLDLLALQWAALPVAQHW
jgi:hypothetical protein